MKPRSPSRPFPGRPKKLRWLAAGGFVLLAILINEVAGKSGYVSRQEQLRRIEALSREIEQLRQQNQSLTQRIHELRSDPEAIEEIAREQLHLARPGEIVVALPPAAPSNPPVASLR
ncbi:MAG TPA: septum formation initiator family protein [Terriglobia bacterium]|nr:septum formation initiator family protein [Terriglobia bacterium]